MSRYLWYSPELLEEPMSRKERSFSVWGREKLLDQRAALVEEWSSVQWSGKDFLNCYDPRRFRILHDRREQMTVLILENKDTWYTFRKLFQKPEEQGSRHSCGRAPLQ